MLWRAVILRRNWRAIIKGLDVNRPHSAIPNWDCKDWQGNLARRRVLQEDLLRGASGDVARIACQSYDHVAIFNRLRHRYANDDALSAILEAGPVQCELVPLL